MGEICRVNSVSAPTLVSAFLYLHLTPISPKASTHLPLVPLPRLPKAKLGLVQLLSGTKELMPSCR